MRYLQIFLALFFLISTDTFASDDETCEVKGGRPRKSSLTVLVVDDTPVQLIVAQRRLKGMGITELNLTTASSRSEAEQAIDGQDYDLVVTDYNMPGGNGDEVAKYLKRRGSLTPVVCCSANDDETLNELKRMKEGEETLFEDVVDKTNTQQFKETVNRYVKHDNSE